ncbi:MAG: hypothetical protein KA831_05970 [Pyrinomonadaceae bacterium]|nr:hypothetical protein [Pyrinomonadaceae bacterium]
MNIRVPTIILVLLAASPCLTQEISKLSPIAPNKKIALPTYTDRLYIDYTIDRYAKVQGKNVVDFGIQINCDQLKYSRTGTKLASKLRLYIRIKSYSDGIVPSIDGDYWDNMSIEPSDSDVSNPATCKPITIHRFFEFPQKGIYKADIWLFDDKKRAGLVYLPFKIE